MPADATFNRLHDVIQTVTNFQSGYPYEDYHLYEFHLDKDGIRVTNDEVAYQEHKFFMKNRQKNEEKMRKNMLENPKMEKFIKAQLNNLKTIIRKPVGLKIDNYLDSYGSIAYTYDFGDNWNLMIELEHIVEDYSYGYPTLLDGAGTAPPKDVGGLPGYEEFLNAYHDQSNPDHQSTKQWAESQRYREYDPNHINRMLKYIKYKKNA